MGNVESKKLATVRPAPETTIAEVDKLVSVEDLSISSNGRRENRCSKWKAFSTVLSNPESREGFIMYIKSDCIAEYRSLLTVSCSAQLQHRNLILLQLTDCRFLILIRILIV